MKTVPDTKTHKQTNPDTISSDDNASKQDGSRKVIITDIDTLCVEKCGDDVRGEQFDNIQRTLDKKVSETTDSHIDDALAANLQDKSVSQHTEVNAEVQIKIMLKQMVTDKRESVSLH